MKIVIAYTFDYSIEVEAPDDVSKQELNTLFENHFPTHPDDADGAWEFDSAYARKVNASEELDDEPLEEWFGGR